MARLVIPLPGCLGRADALFTLVHHVIHRLKIPLNVLLHKALMVLFTIHSSLGGEGMCYYGKKYWGAT